MNQHGLVIVWSVGEPVLRVLRAPATLGRELFPDDNALSRQHLRIEPEYPGHLVLTDLGSSSGTFVDRERLERPDVHPFTTLRAGRTVGFLVDDVSPWERTPRTRAGTASSSFLDPWHVAQRIPELVHSVAPYLVIHASFIEWALWSHFGDEALLDDKVITAARRTAANGDTELRAGAGDSATIAHDFSRFFERILHAPPPFEFPPRLERLRSFTENRSYQTVMVSSHPALEAPTSWRDLRRMPPTWFLAGFIGQREEMSVQYGRVTDRDRIFVQFRCTDPDPIFDNAVRESALRSLTKYVALPGTLPANSVTLVQGPASAHVHIERLDGAAVEARAEHLDRIDLDALARGTS